MKPGLSASEKNEVIKAAYRQIFERDITRAYSLSISDLESKVKNNDISMKEFVRRLAKSPLYQKQFYQPFINRNLPFTKNSFTSLLLTAESPLPKTVLPAFY